MVPELGISVRSITIDPTAWTLSECSQENSFGTQTSSYLGESIVNRYQVLVAMARMTSSQHSRHGEARLRHNYLLYLGSTLETHPVVLGIVDD